MSTSTISPMTEPKVISRLIKNTRTKKRYSNLLDVARDIRWLQNFYGSLSEVAKTLRISEEMLQQFLSVEKLSPKVKKLIRDRRIDSVTIAHKIKNLNESEQNLIAHAVMDGRLTSSDVRALIAMKAQNPRLSIKKLISRIKNSKDIRLYVLKFRLPEELRKESLLRKKIEQLLSQTDIHSLAIENSIAVLTITKHGTEVLRKEARNRKLTLKAFVDEFIRSENGGLI